MTIQVFKQKLSEALEDESILNLDISFNFKELDSWDSFSAMSIIAMIDNEFMVTVSTFEMMEVNSIEALYYMIISKKK